MDVFQDHTPQTPVSSSSEQRRRLVSYPQRSMSVPQPKRYFFQRVQWEANDAVNTGTIIGMYYISNKLSLLTGMQPGWKVYVQPDPGQAEPQLQMTQHLEKLALMPETWVKPVTP